MIITCPCQTCSAPIEFTGESVGKVIACPECRLETRLFVPGGAPPAERNRWPRKNKATLAAALVVLVLLILLLFGRATVLNKLVMATGSAAMGVLALIAGAFFIVWAILWIIFPVFVFFRMTRQEELLKQIEVNTRPR